MANQELVLISALGQAEDKKYYIKDTKDEIYIIDQDMDIVVLDGINAKFLDRTKNCNIHIIGLKDSSITYYVLNSQSSNRCFDIHGELNVVEISISATEESLLIHLLNENAQANVENLSILTEVSSIYTQRIDHKVGSTYSNIKNVGVAMNGSNLVFDTTGKIDKGMAKSKCAQLSRGVVMDNISSITAKPILLIDEYDCFANHGASIGKMSDEDLFYLMSRGLTKKQAFLLILEGIVRPFIDSIPNEELKESMEKEIMARIGE